MNKSILIDYHNRAVDKYVLLMNLLNEPLPPVDRAFTLSEILDSIEEYALRTVSLLNNVIKECDIFGFTDLICSSFKGLENITSGTFGFLNKIIPFIIIIVIVIAILYLRRFL